MIVQIPDRTLFWPFVVYETRNVTTSFISASHTSLECDGISLYSRVSFPPTYTSTWLCVVVPSIYRNKCSPIHQVAPCLGMHFDVKRSGHGCRGTLFWEHVNKVPARHSQWEIIRAAISRSGIATISLSRSRALSSFCIEKLPFFPFLSFAVLLVR